MPPILSRRSALAALAAFTLAAPAFAQNALPTRPVRIVVGYPAGQTVDIVARNFAAALSKEIGQPVIVDNRPGANGSLGAQEVKRSAPDGTTLLLGTLGQMTINPTLYKKLPYDTIKDFAPIAQVSTGALLLVATPTFGPNNLKELIEYAKARPGKVDFASGGNGITAHLAMVVFERQAGLKLNHVPYKGSPAAINDVIAGQVPMMFDALATVLPQVKAGKLKPLAISSAKRNPQLPDVPTVDEQGLKGFDISSWVGFLAPAGTPPATVKALHDAIQRASAAPEIKESIRATGSDLAITTPDEFGRFLQSEIRKWGQAVNDAGVQID
ncbi:tripartite tricarboxylate transporter substrate binding protein [Variovorax sp. OV329]|uniref:Bug family tripartite tricarboxylate transporter substrate binding protein n=1 Tax=Variovorax sp. OV329 TaxID=1882825 RepID=UPI0008DFFAF0|nr:tripartite tricarboxylate transporter substrate binding protein [Variovorax sp. OV329]SFN29299.1 Tripartite-type tricarboxylate transporter, receptor component TctC [Variovorax sp. OV329]